MDSCCEITGHLPSLQPGLLTECLSFSLNMIAYDCTFSSLAGSAPELQYIEISRLYSHYFAFIHVLVP